MFFLFKQKTAYEMRISDWSSDVCSSDLTRDRSFATVAEMHLCGSTALRRSLHGRDREAEALEQRRGALRMGLAVAGRIVGGFFHQLCQEGDLGRARLRQVVADGACEICHRSVGSGSKCSRKRTEEHTAG